MTWLQVGAAARAEDDVVFKAYPATASSAIAQVAQRCGMVWYGGHGTVRYGTGTARCGMAVVQHDMA